MNEKIYGLMIKGLSIGWVYLAPVHSVLIAISVLVLLDLITGCMASIKQKKKITSSGFKATVTKTFIYQCSIIVAMVMETYLLPGTPVIKVVVALITMTEAKSFFENVEVLTGIDFWGKMTDKIVSLINKESK